MWTFNGTVQTQIILSVVPIFLNRDVWLLSNIIEVDGTRLVVHKALNIKKN